MAKFEAIGKALQIPQSVLNNIDAIDKKINLIASDSEKMATHFMSAMTRMGNGADGLLQKLNAIQGVIGKLDLSKFSQSVTTVGQGTTQIEQFAAAIAKAAEAINRYNIENRERANTDNSKQIAQLNKEIETMRRRTQQLEEYINKQRQANQGGGRRGGGSSSTTNSDTKALNAYNRAMAASEALVTQRINKIAKLRNAEEQLRNASGNYATQLNRISQEIARLNRLNEGQVDSYGRVIRSQRNLVNTSQQLTRQLALLFSVSQIEGYISKLVQVRGEFELQQTALASILQNKDEADQLFAQITELAVRSPFTIKELTTYTKSLAAYQVQYEDLYDTTKMLADVSAGLGVDMQRLILAFGQVKAANFLRGTETRQFTEAGINMLGELSKYYTELEGRIVSVQEVQDRQFKRMISFQDVEEVFKRLTSAGGMFYNMQERQAETLAGQMSNLRDQFDLMFNEIGKGNQGAINTSISAIKLLIENWEIFANMLKAAAVGWATYTTTTLIAAAANGKFAASAVAATTSTKGLVGITAKLITSMKALGVFLKTNPITIIATALASAIYFWNDHRKAVEENRKAYDPLVNSVNRTITAVDELNKKIGEQNDRIRTANDNVSQYEKGTSEYARAEANANEEREKQNRLLEELKTKYPEIYNGIIRQKDGTVDYTNALKEFNGQLEQQNYLNYLARQTATGGDNGLLADASKAAEAQQNLKIAADNADNALILMMSRMREYFATNQYASQDLKKQLDEIANSSLSSGEKIYKMFNMIINEHGVNIGDLKDIAWDFVDVGREAMKASNEAKDANERLAESSLEVAENYKKSVIDTGKVSKEEAQEILEMFLKNIGIQNKAVLDFVKQQFEVTIGVKLNLSNQVKQELGEVEKRVNDYLDENQFNLVGRIGIGESFEKYMKELQDSLKSWQKELKELESATGERVAGGTNKQRIDELNTSIAQATETLKYWGKYQKQTTGGGSSKNPELDKLKEQLKIIQQVEDAYRKYREYMSKEEASSMAKQLAEGTVAESVVGTLSLDTSELIEGLEQLSKEAFQRAGEAGQKAVDEVTRKYKEKNVIDIEVEGIEEARKRVESIFQSYEFSLELNTKGIDANAFKEMLKAVGATDAEISLMGLNTTTFKEAQQQLRDEIFKLQQEGGTKQLDEAKKIQEQLTALEIKEANKRFDELLKLREKYQTNEEKIADIETDIAGWQSELDKINELGEAGNQTQKELLEYRIQNGKDTILQLRSEALQLTEFWETLFGDLGEISISSIRDIMRQRDEIIANATPIKNDQGETSGYSSSFIDTKGQKQEVQMTIGQYNQLIKAYQKLKNEYRQRNPLGNFINSLKEGKKEGESFSDYIQRLALDFEALADESFAVADSIMSMTGASSESQQMMQGAKDIVGGTLTAIQGFASKNPLAVIGGLATAIGGIFKIGDAKKEKQIQRQIELVEDLQHAYKKLEEAIDNAYSIDQLNAASDQAEANLKQQAAALEEAIRLEEDKKKTDKDKLKEYQQQLEDVYDQLEELQQEKISKVTNGILDDVLSAADEFTNAWLESFREVGDGMDGLNENFQSILEDMLKRQASMLITGTYIDRWKKELEKYINAEDLELTAGEAKNWVDAVTSSLPGLNNALEEYFKAMQDAGFDLTGEGEGDTLTGLSKSISGITEQQADALAALCESIRFFTSDSNIVLRGIYNFLLAPPAESPLMQEMRVQTTHLSSIDSLLGSVIKNSSGKGRIMRVEIV